MQRIPQQAETEQPDDTPTTFPPSRVFGIWAAHDDDRIATAGAKLREKWCTQADGHPLTMPLMALAQRAWREHWPDGATAGALIYDVAALARHIKRLEARIAELEGGADE